jgi:DNA-binding FadR family transcriptional regulator
MVTQPVTSTRPADEIAAHFRTLIQSGELAEGDRLPPQRALATSLGVSRQTVFEALAALEQEGYVNTLRGASGGTFVCELRVPTERWLERLRASIDDFDDVLDYRIGVERQVAVLAAARRTDDDLLALRTAVDELATSTSLSAYRAADAAFHRALSNAARNDLLADAVLRARASLFFPVDLLDYEPTVAQTAREHLTIVRAIERGDGAAAARAVTTHLEHTRTKLHSMLDEPDRAPRRSVRSTGTAKSTRKSTRKSTTNTSSTGTAGRPGKGRT